MGLSRVLALGAVTPIPRLNDLFFQPSVLCSSPMPNDLGLSTTRISPHTQALAGRERETERDEKTSKTTKTDDDDDDDDGVKICKRKAAKRNRMN